MLLLLSDFLEFFFKLLFLKTQLILQIIYYLIFLN